MHASCAHYIQYSTHLVRTFPNARIFQKSDRSRSLAPSVPRSAGRQAGPPPPRIFLVSSFSSMAHRLRFPSSHLSKVLSISQSVSQHSVHTPDNADSEADDATPTAKFGPS